MSLLGLLLLNGAPEEVVWGSSSPFCLPGSGKSGR